jgi:uncharacterized Tic20 family protein
MNTDTTQVTATLNKFIKVEDGPAYGSGQQSAAADRLHCQLAHLFSPIIWLWKRNASPAVDAHGKEALNFAITLFIVFFAAGIVLAILPHFLASIASLALSLVSLAAFGMAIYGVLQAGRGRLVRYPINFRLIK